MTTYSFAIVHILYDTTSLESIKLGEKFLKNWVYCWLLSSDYIRLSWIRPPQQNEYCMNNEYGILVILLAVVVLLRLWFGEGCHWWDRINQGWPIKPHWLTASVPWIINFVPDHISLPQRNRSSRNIHLFRQYVLRIYHEGHLEYFKTEHSSNMTWAYDKFDIMEFLKGKKHFFCEK